MPAKLYYLKGDKMSDIKVLLVDDEQSFVETLALRLGIRDLKSETVFSGEEAISYIRENEPDVMVLDMKMPGMNGIDVLKWVTDSCPNLQTIILTGYSSNKDEQEARRLGVFDFLAKPPEIEILVDRIWGAYRKRQKMINNKNSTS